jgi:hypothetical protein
VSNPSILLSIHGTNILALFPEPARLKTCIKVILLKRPWKASTMLCHHGGISSGKQNRRRFTESTNVG